MANSKISALTAATTPVAGTETLPIVQSGVTKQVSIANLTAGRSVSALQYQAAINSSTAWAPDTSATNIQVNNSAAAANSTSLYLAQVVDDASTTGGVKFGAVAVASATSGGYSADFVVANRKTGTYYENLRVKYNGDISFVTGNLIQGTAAKGINFTANTALAGKTSQLLNYYEEGTWTVTLTPGTSGTIGLYTTFDECQYTRIGRMMFVSGQIKIISTSAPVGTYVRMSLPSYVADLPEIAGRMGSTVSKSNIVYAALANEGANYIDIQTAASGFAVDEIIAFSFAYVTA